MENRWGKTNSSCRESGSGWPDGSGDPDGSGGSDDPGGPNDLDGPCEQYTAAPIGNTAAPLHPDLATIPYNLYNVQPTTRHPSCEDEPGVHLEKSSRSGRPVWPTGLHTVGLLLQIF